MSHPDFLVIGHAAKDLTYAGYRPGGTVVYSALTARKLGRKVGVITSAGPDLHLGEVLEDIEVVCLASPVTTTFRNVYEEGGRRQYVHAVAERIGAGEVPPAWREAPIVLLGPIAGEIEEDMIDLFAPSLLGLAAQGWLRRWDKQGRVSPCEWVAAGNLLGSVDVLVVSEEDLGGEAQTLRRRLGDPRVAVVTEGVRGAKVFYQGARSDLPARKTTVLDPTGAGDVFAAAFLVRLAETDDPHEAARFANIAASLSVEKAGIASVPTRAQIEAVVADRR